MVKEKRSAIKGMGISFVLSFLSLWLNEKVWEFFMNTLTVPRMWDVFFRGWVPGAFAVWLRAIVPMVCIIWFCRDSAWIFDELCPKFKQKFKLSHRKLAVSIALALNVLVFILEYYYFLRSTANAEYLATRISLMILVAALPRIAVSVGYAATSRHFTVGTRPQEVRAEYEPG